MSAACSVQFSGRFRSVQGGLQAHLNQLKYNTDDFGLSVRPSCSSTLTYRCRLACVNARKARLNLLVDLFRLFLNQEFKRRVVAVIPPNAPRTRTRADMDTHHPMMKGVTMATMVILVTKISRTHKTTATMADPTPPRPLCPEFFAESKVSPWMPTERMIFLSLSRQFSEYSHFLHVRVPCVFITSYLR